jgi:hypothetical protein
MFFWSHTLAFIAIGFGDISEGVFSSSTSFLNDQRAYLLGKRYKEEKKTIGENQYTSKTTEDIKRVDHSEPPKKDRTKNSWRRWKWGGNSYHPKKKTELKKRVQERIKEEPVRPKLGNKVATIANLPPINRPTENIIADQSNVSPKTVEILVINFPTSEKWQVAALS